MASFYFFIKKLGSYINLTAQFKKIKTRRTNMNYTTQMDAAKKGNNNKGNASSFRKRRN